MKKIILDTDIGGDIDDALCLAYLLAQPECNLLGITTVTGEPHKRAELASAICVNAGKGDIPIYAGIAEPLIRNQNQPIADQYSKITGWKRETEFSSDTIEFMRRTIYANPNEVTLLAIGPLTNVAVLFATDPKIPSLLKELVIMGGRFKNDLPWFTMAEWNILCDPHAAQMVFSKVGKNIRCIGLDVTMHVKIDRAESMRKLGEIDTLKPVVDFAEVFFRHSDTMIFHDPLAAAIIFDENICTFERGNIVETELCGRVAGLTHWEADSNGKHNIAVSVEADRFFEHYFGTVAAYTR